MESMMKEKKHSLWLRGISRQLLLHTMLISAVCGWIIPGTCYGAANYQAFGVANKGNAVFFILDAGPEMMMSPSYSMKKEALLSAIRKLPQTYTFNVAVYSGNDTHMLFPEMVSLNRENYEAVKGWLAPLNNPAEGGSEKPGVETLGEGGQKRDDDVFVGPFDLRDEKGQRPEGIDRWFRPVMLAMQMKADSIFLLTNEWGQQPVMIPGELSEKWKNSNAAKRWNENYEKGKQLLREENEKRKAKGQPPFVMPKTPEAINERFFSNLNGPPPDEQREFSGNEYLEGFLAMRNAGSVSKPSRSNKRDISLNVVMLLPKKGGYKYASDRFKELTTACNGRLVILKGEAGLKRYTGK